MHLFSVRVFKHYNNLHTLDISAYDNDIGVIALIDGLRHCNNLHTLDISDNNIENEGIIAGSSIL